MLQPSITGTILSRSHPRLIVYWFWIWLAVFSSVIYIDIFGFRYVHISQGTVKTGYKERLSPQSHGDSIIRVSQLIQQQSSWSWKSGVNLNHTQTTVIFTQLDRLTTKPQFHRDKSYCYSKAECVCLESSKCSFNATAYIKGSIINEGQPRVALFWNWAIALSVSQLLPHLHQLKVKVIPFYSSSTAPSKLNSFYNITVAYSKQMMWSRHIQTADPCQKLLYAGSWQKPICSLNMEGIWWIRNKELHTSSNIFPVEITWIWYII